MLAPRLAVYVALPWLGAEPSAPERAAPSVLTGHLGRIGFSESGEVATVTLFGSERAGRTWPGSRLPLFSRLILGRTSNAAMRPVELAVMEGHARE